MRLPYYRYTYLTYLITSTSLIRLGRFFVESPQLLQDFKAVFGANNYISTTQHLSQEFWLEHFSIHALGLRALMPGLCNVMVPEAFPCCNTTLDCPIGSYLAFQLTCSVMLLGPSSQGRLWNQALLCGAERQLMPDNMSAASHHSSVPKSHLHAYSLKSLKWSTEFGSKIL